MADQSEIAALKASFRGAVGTAASLAALHDRVEGLDERAEVDADLLQDLARITAAHAIASQALRGLVNAMRRRRGEAA